MSTLADALRASLEAADFTVDAVLDRIGDAGQAALGRNSTVASLVALGDADDALATLTRLWPLQQEVPAAAVRRVLPVDQLLDAGLLEPAPGDHLRASVDVRPYGSADDGASGWVVSDLTPGLDQRMTPTRPDYVLGVSPASTTLAQLTMRTPVASALDLGTGCGVQTLHLARHARRIVATDLNPRALTLARLTLALNRVDADLREGSLYEPVAGERFDLIVTNPPFVMSPPRPDAERLTYREGSFAGDGLMHAVVSGAADHLTPGGSLQLLGNWAITDDQPWEERVASWAPPGCDLWVIERERLDVFAYIEMWLTDAGLATSPDWLTRYAEWLDYFGSLGITGVGMGWLTVTRAQRDAPDITVESWPYAVEQPVGSAIAARQAAVSLASESDAGLLARHFAVADHVTQETLGRPGDADPEHIVLRSSAGLRRAMEVDTALGGVLGACDGDMSLDQIVGGVAHLLEVDKATLVGATLPHVRQAIRDGLLLDTDIPGLTYPD